MATKETANQAIRSRVFEILIVSFVGLVAFVIRP